MIHYHSCDNLTTEDESGNLICLSTRPVTWVSLDDEAISSFAEGS